MKENCNFQQPSRRLQQCLSVVCFGVVVFLGLADAHAQQPARPTSTSANSPAIRANGKIAFTSNRDGNREIYLMNNDGTNQVRITNNTVADDFPAWSPDGRRLAFLSQNADGSYVIKLMNADGRDQKALTPVRFSGNFDPFEGPRWGMSWSPDGTKIAFDNGGISIINVDGSNLVNLSTGSHPSWSPDGSRIVFCTQNGSGYYSFRLHTMNADGSNQVELPGALNGNYTQDVDPAWSPDGTRIAGIQQWFLDVGVFFIRDLSGTWHFVDWTIDRNSSSPAWSPDGTKVAYSAVVSPYSQYSNVEIFVVNVDGSGLTQLTNTGGYEAHPAWQPLVPALSANCRIAFTSDRDGNAEIYVMNGDGTGQVRLTDNPGRDEAAAWSPDGGRIAFISSRDGNREIYVMRSDGSNQTRLTNNLLDEFTPAWSPDGNSIAFAREQQPRGFTDIYVMNADGGNQTRVTFNSLVFLAPAWSPDGTRIAFMCHGAICVMNANGSNQIRLTEPSLFDGATEPAWSPDGARIAYSLFPIFNDQWLIPDEIYVMNANGSNQTNLTNSPNIAEQASTWSPDGTRIAFMGSSNGNAEIYVMNSDGSDRVNLTNSPSSNDFDPALWPGTTSASCPNPIDCAEFFVRQHYLDFLNRPADGLGLAFWTNEINLCGANAQCIEVKRINVSAAFFLAIEFQQTGYFVYRMYKSAYGDLPGTPVPLTRQEFLPDTQRVGQGVVVGAFGWEEELENNKNTFANEFVGRSRFTTAFPQGMTAEQFVDALNANAGGVLTQGERDQLVSELASGAKTRAQVLRLVAEDADLAQTEFNKAFVLMQYFGYLRRNPNDSPDANFSGFDFWLNKLNQFNGNFVQAEMVKAFLASTEYRQRFGQP